MHSHAESAKQVVGTLGMRVTNAKADRGDEASPAQDGTAAGPRPAVAGVGSIHPTATKFLEDWSLWQPR